MLTEAHLRAPLTKRVKVLCRPKKLKFGRITILAGPNGSGKNTLIQAIWSAAIAKKPSKSLTLTTSKEVPIMVFDTEHDSPRTKSYIDNVHAIRSRFMSHGEVIGAILTQSLEERLKKDPRIVLMIDEPEAGLDYDALVKFKRMMMKWKKAQFILASHSSVLWMMPEATVIELGERGYVNRVLGEMGLSQI